MVIVISAACPPDRAGCEQSVYLVSSCSRVSPFLTAHCVAHRQHVTLRTAAHARVHGMYIKWRLTAYMCVPCLLIAVNVICILMINTKTATNSWTKTPQLMIVFLPSKADLLSWVEQRTRQLELTEKVITICC